MENGVNCHRKSWKSHGVLLSDFCGNLQVYKNITLRVSVCCS